MWIGGLLPLVLNWVLSVWPFSHLLFPRLFQCKIPHNLCFTTIQFVHKLINCPRFFLFCFGFFPIGRIHTVCSTSVQFAINITQHNNIYLPIWLDSKCTLSRLSTSPATFLTSLFQHWHPNTVPTILWSSREYPATDNRTQSDCEPLQVCQTH